MFVLKTTESPPSEIVLVEVPTWLLLPTESFRKIVFVGSIIYMALYLIIILITCRKRFKEIKAEKKHLRQKLQLLQKRQNLLDNAQKSLRSSIDQESKTNTIIRFVRQILAARRNTKIK